MTLARWVRAGPGGLGRRFLTAFVLMPLTLFVVWSGGRFYAAMIAAMTIFLLFEWTRVVDGAELRRGFYALSITATAASFLAASGVYGWALAVALIGAVVATLAEWPKPNPTSWPIVGVGYIILPAIAALWIRIDVTDGRFLTLVLFISVWAADSSAYLVGKTVGGPKLAPRISPNKTWAGAWGAIVGASLAAGALSAVLGAHDARTILALGAALGGAAVLGDLLESMFKRHYGIKDSGGAFPGHGGVLDRLDGFLLAVLALASIALLLQVIPLS